MKILSSPLRNVKVEAIDKLYVARYSYDKDGNKIEFKGLKDGETFEDYLRRRYTEEMGGTFEVSERGSEAVIALYNKWLESIGNPTNVYEANSREANENLLLDTYLLVLTDKKNVTETRLPLDKVTGIIKDEILPIVDGPQSNANPIPYLEMSPTFQMDKKYEYSGGKLGIGPFALNNKNHVLTQLVRLGFKDNPMLEAMGFAQGLYGIKSKDEYVLPRDKHGIPTSDETVKDEGINILDWISAMINAHVDVAKDPYVIRLNINKYTYNICNFLLRAGFGKSTFFFLPQEILKEMSTAYTRAEGIYGIKQGNRSQTIRKEIDAIRKRYYDRYTQLCRAENIDVELAYDSKRGISLTDGHMLADAIPFMTNRDTLIDLLVLARSNASRENSLYYKSLLLLSEIFLRLNNLAQDVSKLVQLSQIDTKRFGNNFVEQDRFVYRIKLLLGSTELFYRGDLEAYYKNTFLLTKTLNGMVMPALIFQDSMLRSKQSFKDFITTTLISIGKADINDDALAKAISNEAEGFLRYGFYFASDNAPAFKSMFYGPDSMALRLAKIKRDIFAGVYPEMRTPDGKIANRLLECLTSLAKFSTDKYNAPSIIALHGVDSSDKFLKQDLKTYWEELLASPHDKIRNFAQDLIYYQLVTTAGNFTKNGIWNLLPLSAIKSSGYADYMKNTVSDFSSYQDANMFDAIFRNNWQNSKLVPAIETSVTKFDTFVGEFYEDDLFPVLRGEVTTASGVTRFAPVAMLPYLLPTGTNKAGQTLYTPFVKVTLDRTTPDGTYLYQYVGEYTTVDGSRRPLYVLINKLGLNQSGRVIKEHNNEALSAFDFNNIKGVEDYYISLQDVHDVMKKLGRIDLYNGFWKRLTETSVDFVTDLQPYLDPAEDIDLRTIGLVPQDAPTTDAAPATLTTDAEVEVTKAPFEETAQTDPTPEEVVPEQKSFTFNNGFKVELPFSLNSLQQKALYTLEDFVNNPAKYGNRISLIGYAGTGKSTLIGILDKYLRRFSYRNVFYSAPTHRANAVTRMNNPNADVKTLHSLFGLSVRVNLEDSKAFDLRDTKDERLSKPKLKNGSLLIVDEASMIGTSLFKFMSDFAKKRDISIIFVGDDAQLSPVNNNGQKSPVFTQDLTKVVLTKVERTGNNAILEESTRLRNGEDFSYETRGNVEFINDVDRASEIIRSIVSSPEFLTNPLYFRVLSATNAVVSTANNLIRQQRFGNNARLIEVGDIMMGYANIMGDEIEGQLIGNSIDYVVSEVEPVQSKNIYGGVNAKGFNVTLKHALDSDKSVRIFVLDNDNPAEVFSELANINVRINTEISNLWKVLRATKNNSILSQINRLNKDKSTFERNTVSMRTVTEGGRLLFNKALDYGYAHTIHKSQGGTYNNVLIFADTIESFQDDTGQIKQQLKYVAMSRAKDSVSVLTSHPVSVAQTQTQTDSVVPESVVKTHTEVLQELGGVDDATAQQEMKDAITVAKRGITFEEALGTVAPVFTEDEIAEIKKGLKGTLGNKLTVKSVSRNTDPVFFADSVIKFLEENAKKPLSDPTRTLVLELWTKHDGEPLLKLLAACKQYKVAPVVSFSVTSLGNTAIEPGVLEYNTLLSMIQKLIQNKELDPRTTTIRIDPILPGVTNYDDVKNIVMKCRKMGLKKFVVSAVQSYGSKIGKQDDRKVVQGINEALSKVGQTYDWDMYYGRDGSGNIAFFPKQQYLDEMATLFVSLMNEYPDITIQACNTNLKGLKFAACLDPFIMERVVGVDFTRQDGTYDRDTSRPNCFCAKCHSDLFARDSSCYSSCAYCYAGHSSDSNLKYYDDSGNLINRPLTRISGKFIGDPSEFALYTGSLLDGKLTKGGDEQWAMAAKRYGIGKTIPYGPETIGKLSKELFTEVETAYISAAKALGKTPINVETVAGQLVRRDYLQMKSADAVFAVAQMLRPGETSVGKRPWTNRTGHDAVAGGTGYAVQMAMNVHKPIHVFDERTNKWYKFDYFQNKFVEEDTPVLTPRFAGIGSREITQKSIDAIDAVFRKTFNVGSTQQAANNQNNTINIWYSSNENADLSNFAIRPFTYGLTKFQSVEQAFQCMKTVQAGFVGDNERLFYQMLSTTNGAELRRLGKLVKGLDSKKWDSLRNDLMYELIKASFEQNKDAKQRLIATGNAKLTHNQEKTSWKEQFPEILMRVRRELSEDANKIAQPTQPAQQSVQQPAQQTQATAPQQQTPVKTLPKGFLSMFSTVGEAEFGLDSAGTIRDEVENEGKQIKDDCKS